jgi:hypothetical protein
VGKTRDVNWDYLAGFTDGEGCVELRQRSNGSLFTRLRWAQCEEQSWVLHEIESFLWEFGIAPTWETRLQQGRSYCWLSVNRIDDVQFCLRKLLPSLIVKRERAIHAIAAISNWRCLQKSVGRMEAHKHFTL